MACPQEGLRERSKGVRAGEGGVSPEPLPVRGQQTPEGRPRAVRTGERPSEGPERQAKRGQTATPAGRHQPWGPRPPAHRLWGPASGERPLPPWDTSTSPSRLPAWWPPKGSTAVISESMRKGEQESVSHSVPTDAVTPRTVAYQASPSMGFSGKEYWSGLPFPSPGDRLGPLHQTKALKQMDRLTLWPSGPLGGKGDPVPQFTRVLLDLED